MLVVIEGQESLIDINVLANVMQHFASLVSRVHYKLEPDAELDIKVAPFGRGSFEVLLHLKQSFLQQVWELLGSPQAQTLAMLASAVALMIDLKVKLKARRAVAERYNENKVFVLTQEGEELEVDKRVWELYKHDKVCDGATKAIFESLSEEPSAEGFTIINRTEKKTLAKVPRSEFPSLVLDNEYLEFQVKEELEEGVLLHILKVVFQRHRKWEFVYNGFKISAYIDDEDFWNRLLKGEHRFGVGDYIVADMIVRKVQDPVSRVWENREFRIVKVRDVSRAPKQMEMFGDANGNV